MPDLDLDRWAIARSGARGLLAAMAMIGMRTVTVSLGLLEKTPPAAIVEQRAPRAVQRLAEERRATITEVAHWGFGAAGGAAFGMLPRWLRTDPRTGPIYGLSIWLLFELGMAPLLGVRHVEERRLVHRAMLALDHALYGVVVAGRLAPAPEVRAS